MSFSTTVSAWGQPGHGFLCRRGVRQRKRLRACTVLRQGSVLFSDAWSQHAWAEGMRDTEAQGGANVVPPLTWGLCHPHSGPQFPPMGLEGLCCVRVCSSVALQ